MPGTYRNIKRGCGKRKQGGVYAEVGLSLLGKPIEHFIIDPIVRIDPAEIGLSKRKPVLRMTGGRNSIVDWVGETHYPNPVDFIEEARRFGISRRLELSSMEYKLLEPKTPLVLVFNRAWIDEEIAYTLHAERWLPMGEEMGYPWNYCPTGNHENALRWGVFNCAGMLWNRCDIGTTDIGRDRYIERSFASTTYHAARSPETVMDLPADVYKPGAVLMTYIEKLSVVISPDGEHEDKLAKIGDIGIPIEVSEE